MSITTDQYERITRFLDAAMEPAEMDEFEKELAANPEMRRQLDFEQSVKDDFSLRGIVSLPGATPVKEDAAVRVMPGKIRRMRKWTAIGAAAVIAFTFFMIFWQKREKMPDVAGRKDIDTVGKPAGQPGVIVNNPAKDSGKVIDLDQLFKRYFKKDALPEQYPVYLAEALTDYESGNYRTLQQLDLSDVPRTRGAGERDSKENILKWGHYYKGLAFLQTDNTREAAINLYWVLDKHPDKELRAKAQWYLILTYLKENNGKKAAELCRNIAGNKENRLIVKNAEEILAVLRK